jgi:SAM-dependent methyltransferase
MISRKDKKIYQKIRKNVDLYLRRVGTYASSVDNCSLLEIAPQDHRGVFPYLSSTVKYFNLDIDPLSGCNFIADICENNKELISDNFFDIVVCTEVLEHTTNPFLALNEIFRIIKPGGKLYASSPFDFRIHGPLPDNWRFTEYGWRQLTIDFDHVDIYPLIQKGRFLMPLHYLVEATK